MSGLSSVINMITGLIITKMSAKIIGPVGTAYIGKFGNISGLILIIATASIATGIVKYVSEYKDNPQKLKEVIQSAFSIIGIGSLTCCLFVLISANYLNHAAFNDQDFKIVFILYGCFLIIISLQVLVTGILNGLGEINKLTYVNIAASLLNLITTLFLITKFNVIGALLSNSLFGLFSAIVGMIALGKLNFLNKEYFKFHLNLEFAKQLIKYGVFSAITSFSWMWSMIIIREMVEHNLSITDAGLWQAMFSLSDRYLAVITGSMVVYFIPKLSAITETGELVREIRKAFKRILPIMILIAGGIWICRDLIISILLAETFRPMRVLFGFQMMGDVFRVSALILSYIIASKAMFRSGLKADLSFHALLIICTYICLNQFGLVGCSYAYAIACFLYFCIYLIIFKDLIVLIKKSVLPKPWKQNVRLKG
ncbi:MAG: O-antigen translocase [Saprospiraceae bacterium]|nr:O-antigen translocase [Saprospiraceae bacterium]HRG69507.1 O-antigen translocase [Saprospiraceae bacterium]